MMNAADRKRWFARSRLFRPGVAVLAGLVLFAASGASAQSGGEILLTSHETGSDIAGITANIDYAQSFTSAGGSGQYAVTTVSTMLAMAPTAGETVTVHLRETWAGPDLASASIPSEQIGSSFQWVQFDLPDILLQDGASYLLHVVTSGGTLYVMYDSGGGYPGGDAIDANGDTLPGIDGLFQVFGLSAPLPVLAFNTTTTVVEEVNAALYMDITLSLSGAASQDIVVDFGITGGTATEGEDYTLFAQQVTIPLGTTNSTLRINLQDDFNTEPDETIELAMTNVTGAVAGSPADHTVVIVDNDVLPGLTIAKTVDTSDAENGRYRYDIFLDDESGAFYEDLVVRDPLPALTHYVADSATAGGQEIGGEMVWELGGNTPALPGVSTTVAQCPVQIALPVAQDTYISLKDPDKNDAGADKLKNRPLPLDEIKHGLLRFETGLIPESANLISAHLVLVSEKGDPAKNRVEIRDLTTPWDGDVATWNTPEGSNAWAAGNGFTDADYGDVIYDVLVPVGDHTRYRADVTAAVDAWRQGVSHGLVLLDTGSGSGDAEWASSEDGHEERRPVIEVIYTDELPGGCEAGLTLRVGADTYIDEDNPDQNEGDHGDVHLQYKTDKDQVALFHFDVSMIPDHAVIYDATLGVRVKDDSDKVTLHVHRMLTSWHEDAATWNIPEEGGAWAAGAFGPADYDPTPDQSFVPDGNQFHMVDVTALVREWVNDGVLNDGIAVLSSDDDDPVKMYSREDGDLSRHPYLSISWSVEPSRVDTAVFLDVDRGLVQETGLVTVNLRVTSEEPTTVLAPESLDVDTTEGAQATLLSGPVPAAAAISNNAVAFTYVYQVDAGEMPGLVTFSGQPESDDVDLFTAESPGVLAVPPLNFVVELDPINPPGVLINTAYVDSAQMPEIASEPVIVLTLDAVKGEWAPPEVVGDTVKITGSGSPFQEFDLLYVDAPAFQDGLSNQWQLAERGPGPSLVDDGGPGRVAPGLLPGSTLRFYRMSMPGLWETGPQRFATDEVYAFKVVYLRPGQNWVKTWGIPDANQLGKILGRDLPAGVTPMGATRVTWHDAGVTTPVRHEVWLASGPTNEWRWSVGGTGSAETAALPLEEGFVIRVPDGATGVYPCPMIFRVPTSPAQQVIMANRQSTLCGFNVPIRAHPRDMNLLASGFTGGPIPPLSDRIWKYDAAGQQVPNSVWYDTMRNKWRMSSSGFPDVPEGYFGAGEAVYIYTLRSTADWTWTHAIPYSAPTESISP